MLEYDRKTTKETIFNAIVNAYYDEGFWLEVDTKLLKQQINEIVNEWDGIVLINKKLLSD